MKTKRNQLWKSSAYLLGGGLMLAVTLPTMGDPPADPPTCGANLEPIFCARITNIRRTTGDSDRYSFEFAFNNWTQRDAYGILVVLNDGTRGESDGAPYISFASIDADGRPLGPTGICPSGSCPPSGNLAKVNDWIVLDTTPSSVCFSALQFGLPMGAPIPAPRAKIGGVEFQGILDPALDTVGAFTCAAALSAMIPGSVVSGAQVLIPNQETIDNGNNVLDGFVLEVDDFDTGDVLSFDWWLIGERGELLGFIDAVSTTIAGDDFGFGTINLARPVAEGPTDAEGGGCALVPPPPVFTVNTINPGAVNTGFDPPTGCDPNLDSPLFFAEDQSTNGIDTFPINPIPAGFPGQGSFFHMEIGATVTAPPINPADLPPGTGVNLLKTTPAVNLGPGCPDPSGFQPVLSASGSLLATGGNFSLSFTTPPGSIVNTALLLPSLNLTSWVGGSLPADLTPFGYQGCLLYVSTETVLSLPVLQTVPPTSQLFVGFSSNPQLVGTTLGFQAVTLGFQIATGVEVGFSNGLAVTVAP